MFLSHLGQVVFRPAEYASEKQDLRIADVSMYLMQQPEWCEIAEERLLHSRCESLQKENNKQI